MLQRSEAARVAVTRAELLTLLRDLPGDTNPIRCGWRDQGGRSHAAVFGLAAGGLIGLWQLTRDPAPPRADYGADYWWPLWFGLTWAVVVLLHYLDAAGLLSLPGWPRATGETPPDPRRSASDSPVDPSSLPLRGFQEPARQPGAVEVVAGGGEVGVLNDSSGTNSPPRSSRASPPATSLRPSSPGSARSGSVSVSSGNPRAWVAESLRRMPDHRSSVAGVGSPRQVGCRCSTDWPVRTLDDRQGRTRSSSRALATKLANAPAAEAPARRSDLKVRWQEA